MDKKRVLMFGLVLMLFFVAGNAFAKSAGAGDEEFFFKEGDFFIRSSLAEHYDVDVLADFSATHDLPIKIVLVESFLDYLYLKDTDPEIKGTDVLIIRPLNTSSPESGGYSYYIDSNLSRYINNQTEANSGMSGSQFIREVYLGTRDGIKDSSGFSKYDVSNYRVNNSLALVTLASMFSLFNMDYAMNSGKGVLDSIQSDVETFFENTEKMKQKFTTFGTHGYCAHEGDEPENLYEFFAEVTGEYDYSVFEVLKDFDTCLPVEVEGKENTYDADIKYLSEQLSELGYLFKQKLEYRYEQEKTELKVAERLAALDPETEEILLPIATNPGKFSAVLDKIGKNKDIFRAEELDFQYIFAAPSLFLSDDFYYFLRKYTNKDNRDLKELINHNLNADYGIVNYVASQFGSSWTLERTYRLLDLMKDYAVRGKVAKGAISNFINAFGDKCGVECFLSNFPYFASKFQTSFYRGTDNIKMTFNKMGFDSLSEYFRYLDENIPLSIIEEMGLNEYLYPSGDISEMKGFIENYPFVDYENYKRYFSGRENLVQQCPLVAYYKFSEDTFGLLSNSELSDEQMAKFICGEPNLPQGYNGLVDISEEEWKRIKEDPWHYVTLKDVGSLELFEIEGFVKERVVPGIRLFNLLRGEYPAAGDEKIASQIALYFEKSGVLPILRAVDPEITVFASGYFAEIGVNFEPLEFNERNQYFRNDPPSPMCMELIYKNGLDHKDILGNLISSGYLTEASCPLYLTIVQSVPPSSGKAHLAEFTRIIESSLEFAKSVLKKEDYHFDELGKIELQYALMRYVLVPEFISENSLYKPIEDTFSLLESSLDVVAGLFAVDYTYGNYEGRVHPALLKMTHLREDYDLSSFSTYEDLKIFLGAFTQRYRDYKISLGSLVDSRWSPGADFFPLAFFSYFELIDLYEENIDENYVFDLGDVIRYPLTKEHFSMVRDGVVSPNLARFLYVLASVGESKASVFDYNSWLMKVTKGTSNLFRYSAIFFQHVAEFFWEVTHAVPNAIRFYNGEEMETALDNTVTFFDATSQEYLHLVITGQLPLKTLRKYVFFNTDSPVRDVWEDKLYEYVINKYIMAPVKISHDKWNCEDMDDLWVDFFLKKKVLYTDYISDLFYQTKYLGSACTVEHFFGDKGIQQYVDTDGVWRDPLINELASHVSRRFLGLFNAYRFNEMVRAPVLDESLLEDLLQQVRHEDVLLSNAIALVASAMEEYVSSPNTIVASVLKDKISLIRNFKDMKVIKKGLIPPRMIVYRHAPQDLYPNTRSFDDFFVDSEASGGYSAHYAYVSDKMGFLNQIERASGINTIIVATHGTPFSLYDGESFLSYKELAKSIHKAWQDSPISSKAKFDLVLLSCNSYQFAQNLLKELYKLYSDPSNVPIDMIFTTGKDGYLASMKAMDLLNAELNSPSEAGLFRPKTGADLLLLDALSMGFKPIEPISYDFGIFVKGKGKMQEIASLATDNGNAKI